MAEFFKFLMHIEKRSELLEMKRNQEQVWLSCSKWKEKLTWKLKCVEKKTQLENFSYILVTSLLNSKFLSNFVYHHFALVLKVLIENACMYFCACCTFRPSARNWKLNFPLKTTENLIICRKGTETMVEKNANWRQSTIIKSSEEIENIFHYWWVDTMTNVYMLQRCKLRKLALDDVRNKNKYHLVIVDFISLHQHFSGNNIIAYSYQTLCKILSRWNSLSTTHIELIDSKKQRKTLLSFCPRLSENLSMFVEPNRSSNWRIHHLSLAFQTVEASQTIN